MQKPRYDAASDVTYSGISLGTVAVLPGADTVQLLHTRGVKQYIQKEKRVGRRGA